MSVYSLEEEYFELVGFVWEAYLEDRKAMRFGGMSMKERDELLTDLRNDLYKLQKETEK